MPPPDDPEALARRFEPILFFHPDERFFPSDAKTYVEQCALWKAETPFDVKDSWGGKGSPFPRSPEIKKGEIAAVAGEPGILLSLRGFVNNVVEENFFELAGWFDPTAGPVDSVTASSKNTYSERDDLAPLYEIGKLRDSKFWYHAEFFENQRLRDLLNGVENLGNVLFAHPNAALLCYYFFFPAHEEPVANKKWKSGTPEPPCTNLEAKEFNNFAGEWACMAVLLDRTDPKGEFAPKFLGFSGRLTENASAAQFDDSDNFGKGLVMTVVPFNPSQVQLIAEAPGKPLEHPQLFVSLGTHAFYLAPGKNTLLFPIDSPPYDCGRFDGPPIPTTGPDSGDKNPDPEPSWSQKRWRAVQCLGLLARLLG